MSRNGAGVYSLPSSPFQAGTTIDPAPMNSNFSDIAAQITNSVAADGQTTMTGDLNLGSHAISNATNITASGVINAGTIATTGTIIGLAGTIANLMAVGSLSATSVYAGTMTAAVASVSGQITAGNVVSTGTATVGNNLGITRSAGNAYLELNSSGGSGRIYRAVSYSDGTFAITDITGGVNRFSIDPSGNYYFGGASTVASITAGGQISSVYGYQCRTGTAGGFEGHVFNLSWDGANVGVYIDATAIGNINFTSDPRIKQNITDAPIGALSRVMSWRVIEYEYRDVDVWKHDGARRLGFDASQLQQISPQSVFGEKDAVTPDGKIVPLTLNPIAMVAEIAQAVQELARRVSALDGQA